MMKLPLFIGLCMLLLSFKNNEQSAWSLEMYQQYTYRNYENYAPFTEQIDPNTLDIALLNAAVFYETNKARVQQNIAPLKHIAQAEIACVLHARDMVKEDFFSHRNPNIGRETTSKRLEEQGIRWRGCAENIATAFIYPIEGESYYPPTLEKNYFRLQDDGAPIQIRTYAQMAKEILHMWMNSTGHRKNILNPAYTHLGCGNYMKLATKMENMPKIYSAQNFVAFFKDPEIQNN